MAGGPFKARPHGWGIGRNIHRHMQTINTVPDTTS